MNDLQDVSRHFSEEELYALRELNINPAELIITEQPLLRALKIGGIGDKLGERFGERLGQDKHHVCRLKLTDGLYSVEPPPDLPRKLRKNLDEIERRLLAINNTHMRKLMTAARKNAEFVARFNSELFFKHCFYKGKRITVPELFDFYETHPFYRTINLSADCDKSPFISLYAMTFYACTPDDLFTIDGIFSVQPERHADNAKKIAGNSVLHLLMRDDRAEMEQAVTQMGQTLLEVRPLRVDIADAVTLSKSYSIFAGLAEIGRVYAQVARNLFGEQTAVMPYLTAAEALLKYVPVVQLCDSISVIGDTEDYRKMPAYGKCAELFL